MQPVLHRMPVFLEGHNTDIAWWEWGDADAKPIVCLHGLTRQGRDFDVIAAALAARGRRVLAPDLPGRGRSEWLKDAGAYAYPTYAAAMAQLVAVLAEPVDWIGSSLGGIVGMMLAAAPTVPIRRLVLNDVGPLIPAAALARIRDYIGYAPAFPDIPALETHLRKVHAPFGALSDAEWRAMAIHSSRVLPDGRIGFHYDPAIAVNVKAQDPGDVDLSPLWQAVRDPVLAVRGEESDLLLPETFAQMAADGAETHVVPGAGHAPMLNDAASISRVAAFLQV
jgi:pimeloyl-ACP methyl ester carboxylesterase